MTTTDDGTHPVMARIGAALALGQQGRRAEAREAFAAIWADVEGGDPLHRLTLAHHMADVQDDAGEEHLNLGQDYRKLGDLPAARRHLDLGSRAARALDDDGYGSMIKAGLTGLADRLAAEPDHGRR